MIGVVGVGDVTACLESLEAMPQVEKAVRISAPYKFVSKEFKPDRTRIALDNGVEIGGDEFIVMAGPVLGRERKADHGDRRRRRQSAARTLLRGGAFKPRTSPYDFQGMEEEGLKLLRKAKEATGLGIITEVMSDRDVELVAEYADILQIGARNMQNFALLKTLGKCGRPVLLKRGLSSTIKELLMSAEYIVAHGNPNVMLCERGIRTFETATRNTCDIAAVPVLNELTHLPVILDPSHATGKRSLVPAALARRRGDRRRRHDRRSASASGEGHQRRRAIARPPAVRQNDARTQPLHRLVGVLAQIRRSRRHRLTNTAEKCVGAQHRCAPSPHDHKGFPKLNFLRLFSGNL